MRALGKSLKMVKSVQGALMGFFFFFFFLVGPATLALLHGWLLAGGTGLLLHPWAIESSVPWDMCLSCNPAGSYALHVLVHPSTHELQGPRVHEMYVLMSAICLNHRVSKLAQCNTLQARCACNAMPWLSHSPEPGHPPTFVEVRSHALPM